MGIPRVGALTPRSRGPPAPRGIPAPPAGALRALRDPLLGAGQLLSAATCSYGSFFRISPKKKLFSAPLPSRVLYLGEPNVHVSGAEVVSFGKDAAFVLAIASLRPPRRAVRDRRGV